jgi:hypothetical protein
MKKRPIFLILILFALFMNSCKYDFILAKEVPVITGPVSFSTQVLPIFSSDNCTDCHNGSQSPNLTAASAYAQIVPALINTATPETSPIYSFPSPTSATHSWKKYSTGDAAIVLAWIKDGAQNN